MILPDLNGFEDAQEYAAKIGAYHYCAGLGLNDNLFGFNSPTAVELRLIYELGYLMEQESNCLYETSSHTSIAVIKEWNELRGFGVVRFFDRDQQRDIDFTYHDIKGDEEKLAEGKEVKVYYRFSPALDLVLDGIYL